MKRTRLEEGVTKGHLWQLKTVTVEEAINILNSIVAADEQALKELINYRVPCNEILGEHPTVQAHRDGDGNYSVGLLGIINGLFGIHPETFYGHITMQAEMSGRLNVYGKEKMKTEKIQNFRLTKHADQKDIAPTGNQQGAR